MVQLLFDMAPLIKDERKKALQECARIAPVGSVRLQPAAPHLAGKRKQKHEEGGRQRLDLEVGVKAARPHKTIGDYWQRAQPDGFGFQDLIGYSPFLVQYLGDWQIKFIAIKAVEAALHSFGSIGERIMVITEDGHILVPPTTRIHWRRMR